jgi:hypothetical protein
MAKQLAASQEGLSSMELITLILMHEWGINLQEKFHDSMER